MGAVHIVSSIYLFCIYLTYGSAKEVELSIDVLPPSGIIIDRQEDPNDGSIYRFGRLRLSAVNVRPEWEGVKVVENIFSSDEAAQLIEKAEKHAKEHGWSKGRHIDYGIRPTKDLPLSVLYSTPEEYSWLEERFRTKLFPKYNQFFGINASMLVVDDLFITKYSAESNTASLAPHIDKSPWSFVIPLNDQFEGGGTFFTKYQRVWKGPVGSAVIFHGYQAHGGK
jgi:hypothetical protein